MEYQLSTAGLLRTRPASEEKAVAADVPDRLLQYMRCTRSISVKGESKIEMSGAQGWVLGDGCAGRTGHSRKGNARGLVSYKMKRHYSTNSQRPASCHSSWTPVVGRMGILWAPVYSPKVDWD